MRLILRVRKAHGALSLPPLHSLTALRVKKRLRGGSSAPVVVETSSGLFVMKLRGAGEGVLALVAELIVAEVAERLGLPVPERALIELSREVPSDDKNDELADTLGRSVGTNLGLRFLEGAREARKEELAALDDDFVGRVLWLDGLVMNPDRTRSNPNILLWKGRPWLIDHGAALSIHHDWSALTEDSPREPTDYTRHVFSERLAALAPVDAAAAASVTRENLEQALGVVPSELLSADPREAARLRAQYHAFLWKRLKPPRPFSL
jgi:hypothetical protein